MQNAIERITVTFKEIQEHYLWQKAWERKIIKDLNFGGKYFNVKISCQFWNWIDFTYIWQTQKMIKSLFRQTDLKFHLNFFYKDTGSPKMGLPIGKPACVVVIGIMFSKIFFNFFFFKRILGMLDLSLKKFLQKDKQFFEWCQFCSKNYNFSLSKRLINLYFKWNN